MTTSNIFFGEVTKYTDKGFGFITPISTNAIGVKPIFFHIKQLIPLGLRQELEIFVRRECRIFLWFRAEMKEKGLTLVEGWRTMAEVKANGHNGVSVVLQAKDFFAFDVLKMLFTEDGADQINFSVVGGPSFVGMRAHPSRQFPLSRPVLVEVLKWVNVFNDGRCTYQKDANEIITRENRWNEFPNLRSLNDHGMHKRVPGIESNYYSLFCYLLGCGGAGGAPLEASHKY
ncbi:MAG: hypothetical protein K2Q15_16435 [Burkholderiales bacterium]|nr:hypothetical protein [Burkholderiales bacterium]